MYVERCDITRGDPSPPEASENILRIIPTFRAPTQPRRRGERTGYRLIEHIQRQSLYADACTPNMSPTTSATRRRRAACTPRRRPRGPMGPLTCTSRSRFIPQRRPRLPPVFPPTHIAHIHRPAAPRDCAQVVSPALATWEPSRTLCFQPSSRRASDGFQLATSRFDVWRSHRSYVRWVGGRWGRA